MTSRLRHARADEARALGVGLRVRQHGGDPRRARCSARGDQRVPDGVDDLADDAHVRGLHRERVQRRPDRALRRVLDGDERPLDGALLHGQRRRRRSSAPGRRPSSAARASATQRRVGVGPLRPEVRGPHVSSTREPSSPASARRTASASSGESSSSPSPAMTCLQYSRADSRWAMRREHHAVVLGVEQRHGRRLVARQLAVGVVADQRAVGQRAVEAVLGGPHARLELRGGLLDAGLQRLERVMERRGVPDQVLRPVRAQDHPLIGPQPPDAQGQHQHADEGDDRHARGGQGDDPGAVGEAIHLGE